MNRRIPDLRLAAALSVVTHAAVVVGASYAVGTGAPVRVRSEARNEQVVMLGAEETRALLEPQVAPMLPDLREASTTHATELAPLFAAAARTPAPPAAPSPVRALVSSDPNDRTLTVVASRERAEHLTPAPAVVLDTVETDAPAEAAPASPSPAPSVDDGGASDEERALAPLDRSAVILHRPPLEYPSRARRAGIEGVVVVGLEPAADGSVARAWLLRSSGNALLDRAAVENVRRWRLDPATLGDSKGFRQSVRFFMR